jgi:WD40 repeat protein
MPLSRRHFLRVSVSLSAAWSLPSLAQAHDGTLRFDSLVTDFACSPDGQSLAAILDNGSLIIERIADGDRKTIMGSDAGYETGEIAYLPNGESIAVVDVDSVRLWDAKSGVTRGDAMRHEEIVKSFAVAPDSTRIITTSGDRLLIWDAATGKLIAKSSIPYEDVHSAVVSPDGRLIAMGVGENEAWLWDAAAGKQLGAAMRHDGHVMGLAFSPDGKRVATASTDKSARQWDAATGQPIGDPMIHKAQVHSAEYASDGLRMLTTSAEHSARLWDATSGKPLGEAMVYDGVVASASFSPDGKLIVTSSGSVHLWDGFTGKLLRTVPYPDDNSRTLALFAPGGRQIACANGSTIALVDI